MAKKIPDLQIKIKGKDWIVKFRKQKAYEKELDHTEVPGAAITHPDTRIIGINLDIILPEQIRHELFHALFTECNVESADLTPIQVEEVCSSLAGEYAIDIIKIADYILTHIHLNS